jgi:hypothetical protein
MKHAHTIKYIPYPGSMRGGGGFSRYIGPGPGDPRRSPWIFEEPQSLSHRRLIFIFYFFGGYFQLFLCKIHLDFWIMVVYHHSHLCNVTRKVIISLQVVLLALKSSILREVSACPRAPKAVFFRLAGYLS